MGDNELFTTIAENSETSSCKLTIYLLNEKQSTALGPNKRISPMRYDAYNVVWFRGYITVLSRQNW